MICQMVQVSLGIQRRHTTGSGRSYRLAVDMVADITGGKYPLDTGRGCIAIITALDADIAILHLQLTRKDRGIGLVTNGNKNTLQFNIFRAVICYVFDAHTGHTTVISQHFIKYTVPCNAYHTFSFFPEQAVLENFLATQLIPTVHQRYMRSNIGQVQRLLNGGIATANHCHRLLLVEKSITGGTGGYPFTLEGFLGWQPQVHGRGTGGNNQGITGIDTRITLQPIGPGFEINRVDVVKDNFGVKALGVQAHILHQRRALQSFITTGPVLDLCGCH